jgi:hypothetical protein
VAADKSLELEGVAVAIDEAGMYCGLQTSSDGVQTLVGVLSAAQEAVSELTGQQRPRRVAEEFERGNADGGGRNTISDALVPHATREDTEGAVNLPHLRNECDALYGDLFGRLAAAEGALGSCNRVKKRAGGLLIDLGCRPEQRAVGNPKNSGGRLWRFSGVPHGQRARNEGER